METSPVKLVTIVAESVLQDRLTELVLASGASGYTLSEASGVGSRGRRSTTLGGHNIRIEVLLGEGAAARLMEALARDYFPHYAIVAWAGRVEVGRPEKFGPQVD